MAAASSSGGSSVERVCLPWVEVPRPTSSSCKPSFPLPALCSCRPDTSTVDRDSEMVIKKVSVTMATYFLLGKVGGSWCSSCGKILAKFLLLAMHVHTVQPTGQPYKRHVRTGQARRTVSGSIFISVNILTY